MKIKSPVPSFNGIVAGVVFRDGFGESDNSRIINHLSSKGYMIEKSTPDINTKEPTKPVKEKGGNADARKD